MSDELRDELRELGRLAREWLAWEQELGGVGLPSTRPTSARIAKERAEAPPTAASPAPTAIAAPPRAPEEVVARLAVLAREAAACSACPLHAGRTNSVFARGNPASPLAFVGEGPGYNEDQQGLPFVGQAGQLLDRMIAAMGYHPDDVYVCNVVKCRPPENRTPLPDEARACSPFLAEQLGLVAPRAIVALGRCAAENLGVMPPDGRGWRGRWDKWNGVPVMSTYHPAFLLRSPQFKKQVWEDLQLVMALLGRPGS